MWKVSKIIEEELKSYEENQQDYIICIYENGIQVASELIYEFKEKAAQYMDRKVKHVEYFTESAYVYIF